MADLGFELRDTRVWADYRNPFPGNLTTEVDRTIATSATIIALLGEM
ncbi:MAG: hypothetical protein KC442_12465 [Thermomicrobiales bacterium]|nr:hypothetical protein [Thermomicrobiales bacterium]